VYCILESSYEICFCLDDISPKEFAIILCHLYGIFTAWHCDMDATTYNIAQIADMFSLDDFKYVISFCLQRDLCHFFHRPCSGINLRILMCS